jgi:hypothetical protein
VSLLATWFDVDHKQQVSMVDISRADIGLGGLLVFWSRSVTNPYDDPRPRFPADFFARAPRLVLMDTSSLSPPCSYAYTQQYNNQHSRER